MSQLSQYPVLRGPLSYLPGLVPTAPGLVALKDRLGGFRKAVCNPGLDFDIERGRSALDHLAAELDIGVCSMDDSHSADQQLLGHLSNLVAAAARDRSGNELGALGGGYAAVVAAMTRIHPHNDYSAPLGQLLEMMARLFSQRENAWKDIYKCLRSIPDSVAAKQALTRICLAEIREWFDAGVQNLFSLQEQLEGQIASVREKIAKIDERLSLGRAQLHRQRGEFGNRGNVTSLGTMVAKREIRESEQRLADAYDELEGRESTLELIESDIADFERILHGARRTYRLQVV